MKHRDRLISICIIAVLFSCRENPGESAAVRDRLIAEGVEIKLSEFRSREWNKCLERARTIAVAEADSVIRARAKDEAVEPVIKPPKPERPSKPETKSLPDSVRTKTQGDGKN